MQERGTSGEIAARLDTVILHLGLFMKRVNHPDIYLTRTGRRDFIVSPDTFEQVSRHGSSSLVPWRTNATAAEATTTWVFPANMACKPRSLQQQDLCENCAHVSEMPEAFLCRPGMPFASECKHNARQFLHAELVRPARKDAGACFTTVGLRYRLR